MGPESPSGQGWALVPTWAWVSVWEAVLGLTALSVPEWACQRPLATATPERPPAALASVLASSQRRESA